MKSTIPLIVLAALVLAGCKSPTATDVPETETGQRARRMAWFNEARFGMFIHWGLYAQLAGEWKGQRAPSAGEWIMQNMKIPVSEYSQLTNQFNPVKFDAREWARIARDAGMKYMVITSKHHDGFGLFRSDLTDWCIKSTPFQRDPLKELADACQEAGIRFCFYHSILDWHHPDYAQRREWNDTATGTPDMDRYVTFMKGQLRELLTRYGPIGILWFDGEWEAPWTHERGVDLYNYVRSLQPDIIVNNRVGKGRAGMAGMDSGAERVGDYGTPEQEIPARGFGPDVYWESCMTMNGTWGYRKDDLNWKSTETLIRNLIDCASKGGNYLLNVGPTAEGLIPEASVTRLAEIGQWMKVNGESIHATSASAFNRLPWGRSTTKLASNGATLYLHVFQWPADGRLLVPGLKSAVQRAYLLSDASRRPLATMSGEQGVTVSVPASPPDKHSTTVVLQINGELIVVPTRLTQNDDGSITLPAAEAVLHGNTIRHESGGDRDNLGYWTSPNDWAEWEFNALKPGRFEVTAELAALEAAAFEIRLNEQRLRGSAPVTGDYGKFETVTLGILEIPAAGKFTLAVRPIRQDWQPINLRAIRFQPAN